MSSQIKRDELAARAKMAEAQRQVQESVKSINAYDPTSDLGRYEDKIRRRRPNPPRQRRPVAHR